MKDYKVKEALCNLKQSFDLMKEKFEALIDVLEMEEGIDTDCACDKDGKCQYHEVNLG